MEYIKSLLKMVKNQPKNAKPSFSDCIVDILPDFPPGPLDDYRKQATFNFRDLSLVMDDEETIRFKHLIWKKMEDDPLFAHSPVEPSLEDNRCITLERAFKISTFMPKDLNPRLSVEVGSILGQYDWSLTLRRAILLGFFTNAVRGLGTEKHNKFIRAAEKHQLVGCVAMTEISHGTNTKAFRTKCTFDKIKKKFILHTPDFEAAKCWAGNMKTANYAYVLAQLYTADDQCHGLHAFVVPIRDSQMNLLPGVIIGDMGQKVGLNGLDNGFMMFDNYELELDALLNKTGNVTPEGLYVSPIKDPKKRFSASLGNLAGPRVGIVSIATANSCNAITIAIRYAAVRRQFGPTEGSPEYPVIEYQMQQFRLFTCLASTYVFKFFSRYLYDILFEFVISQFSMDITPEQRSAMGVELHGIASAAKPLAGWLSRDTIQESREACGGHGYLLAAGISRLRNDGDSFLTFEGDNNVLLQQTSQWLINVWANPEREKTVRESPFGALTFLRNAETRLKKKFQFNKGKADFLDPKTILQSYKWLTCWLLRSTSRKFHSINAATDAFTARNESQVFHAKTLSLSFIEHYALEIFWTKLCSRTDIPVEIQNVLTKLFLLNGLWSMEKHLGIFYEGGYFSGSKPAKFIKETILEICTSLKGEAVSLVDVLAPPDFILNSVLGQSDGLVYKHLELAMKGVPGSFEKLKGWASISNRLISKL